MFKTCELHIILCSSRLIHTNSLSFSQLNTLHFFHSNSYTPFLLKTSYSYTPYLPLNFIHICTHPGFFSSSYTPLASSKLHTTPVFLTTSFIPYLPLHFIQSLSSYPFHTLHSSFSTSYTTNLFHSQSSSQLRTFRVFIPTTYCTTSLLPP